MVDKSLTVSLSESPEQIRADRDRLAYLESIWRLAVDNTDQGCWDINLVSDQSFNSDGWKRIRGYDASWSGYETYELWFDHVHPDDRDFVRVKIDAHNSGEEPEWEFSYRERKRDGRWVWILSRGRAVAWDSNGRPTRLLGTDIDITDVKEREIKRSAADKKSFQLHVATIREAHAETEEARLNLQQLAHSDQLSGLPNRRYFIEKIQTMTAPDGGSFGVILVDIDDFKKINDRHGHHAGDHVIEQTARRLSEAFLHPHLVARLGGDEFGILALDLGECPDVRLEALAQRVVDVMAPSFVLDGVPLAGGGSAGAALFPRDGIADAALLKSADLALYRAKGLGKGRSGVYDAALGREAAQQLMLEAGLRQAIQEEQIKPFFQPIVDIKTGSLSAVEVLARWHCPQQGDLLPDVFMPVAAKLGLLSSLTESMMRQALPFVKTLSQDIKVSFNLSPDEVCDIATPLLVSTLLAAHNFPSSRIIMEVTEQAFVRNIFSARQVIAALRNIGVEVYLDDFGAGYSGLCYLKDLQVDGLKLDKSFAQSIIANPASKIIMESMFDLASRLSVAHVVEGVENGEAHGMVKAMGAGLCQGYHFAKPMPEHALRSYVLAATAEKRAA